MKNKTINQKDYFIIVPSQIRKNNRLTSLEKLIYGEILSLTQHIGYCSATNKHYQKSMEQQHEL